MKLTLREYIAKEKAKLDRLQDLYCHAYNERPDQLVSPYSTEFYAYWHVTLQELDDTF